MNNKKNLLGICGSPRTQGTEFAIKYALNYVKEKFDYKTEFWTVKNKDIKFCIHCDYCIREKKGCVHKDDMQELYLKLERTRFILFGTPVFQGTVSGQIKVIMDRCRALLAKDPNIFKNKIGIGIAVGGDRNGGQETAIRTILDFFQQNHMISVSGGAFGANLGASLWSKDKGKEGVEKDIEGLRTIRKVLKRMEEFNEQILNIL
ncbi:MAG: flavodoxin family protein [Candidatus Lokiarchaeota archaeon]|nr:flavodoxin family protein [Candidatus Lokiarchaeota archaeon]